MERVIPGDRVTLREPVVVDRSLVLLGRLNRPDGERVEVADVDTITRLVVDGLSGETLDPSVELDPADVVYDEEEPWARYLPVDQDADGWGNFRDVLEATALNLTEAARAIAVAYSVELASGEKVGLRFDGVTVANPGAVALPAPG